MRFFHQLLLQMPARWDDDEFRDAPSPRSSDVGRAVRGGGGAHYGREGATELGGGRRGGRGGGGCCEICGRVCSALRACGLALWLAALDLVLVVAAVADQWSDYAVAARLYGQLKLPYLRVCLVFLVLGNAVHAVTVVLAVRMHRRRAGSSAAPGHAGAAGNAGTVGNAGNASTRGTGGEGGGRWGGYSGTTGQRGPQLGSSGLHAFEPALPPSPGAGGFPGAEGRRRYSGGGSGAGARSSSGSGDSGSGGYLSFATRAMRVTFGRWNLLHRCPSWLVFIIAFVFAPVLPIAHWVASVACGGGHGGGHGGRYGGGYGGGDSRQGKGRGSTHHAGGIGGNDVNDAMSLNAGGSGLPLVGPPSLHRSASTVLREDLRDPENATGAGFLAAFIARRWQSHAMFIVSLFVQTVPQTLIQLFVLCSASNQGTELDKVVVASVSLSVISLLTKSFLVATSFGVAAFAAKTFCVAHDVMAFLHVSVVVLTDRTLHFKPMPRFTAETDGWTKAWCVKEWVMVVVVLPLIFMYMLCQREAVRGGGYGRDSKAGGGAQCHL